MHSTDLEPAIRNLMGKITVARDHLAHHIDRAKHHDTAIENTQFNIDVWTAAIAAIREVSGSIDAPERGQQASFVFDDGVQPPKPPKPNGTAGTAKRSHRQRKEPTWTGAKRDVLNILRDNPMTSGDIKRHLIGAGTVTKVQADRVYGILHELRSKGIIIKGDDNHYQLVNFV